MVAMLICLHISNLAIIREARLDLAPGLNLLTGETGAGKSILVDALLLLLGGRAGADLVREGAERVAIEAEFDLAANPAARTFLDGHGYAGEGTALVTSNPARVFALDATLATEGTFVSKVKDTETVSSWGRLFVIASPELDAIGMSSASRQKSP